MRVRRSGFRNGECFMSMRLLMRIDVCVCVCLFLTAGWFILIPHNSGQLFDDHDFYIFQPLSLLLSSSRSSVITPKPPATGDYSSLVGSNCLHVHIFWNRGWRENISGVGRRHAEISYQPQQPRIKAERRQNKSTRGEIKCVAWRRWRCLVQAGSSLTDRPDSFMCHWARPSTQNTSAPLFTTVTSRKPPHPVNTAVPAGVVCTYTSEAENTLI